VQRSIELKAGARVFLLDLDAGKSPNPRLLAAACKALPLQREAGLAWTVEGIGETPAILLISTAKPPRSVELEEKPLDTFTYDSAEGLLYVRFKNESRPRKLSVEFN
jgi:hypothetical protein